MNGNPVIPKLSRGFFLGAIVSAVFWLFWPQVPSKLAAIAAFLACAILSIALGVKARATVAGKTGLIGSSVLVILVITLNVVIAVVFYNKREALKHGTLELELGIQRLGNTMDKRSVEPGVGR